MLPGRVAPGAAESPQHTPNSLKILERYLWTSLPGYAKPLRRILSGRAPTPRKLTISGRACGDARGVDRVPQGCTG